MRSPVHIQNEIDDISAALSHIRRGGQSFTISSGAGGTSRTVTMADYNTLVKQRDDLYTELAQVRGGSTRSIRAGW